MTLPMSARGSRWLLVVRALSLAGIAAFSVHALVPDGPTVARVFDDWVYYALSWLAVATCAARVALVPRDRGGWLALTIGLALWAAGDFYYAHWIGTQPEPPFPSLADAGYLAFYPFAYVGFVLLFRTRVTRLTAGIWIDGITAGLAVAAVGAAVLLEVVLETTSGSFGAVATNLAYPLGDMLLIALVVAAFSVVRWRPGRAWLILGAALAVNAVGDAVYLYAISTGNYREGTLLDATWPAAMLLLAQAAWTPAPARVPVETEGKPLFALPAACGSVAVGVLVLDHFDRLNAAALALAAATVAGVVVRLWLTFRENGRLFELTRSEAVTDALTGLGNRRRLTADLERALVAATSEQPWLLVVFDLDGFKSYNDAFGHPAGDALLVRLGARLAAAVGSNGAAYRLGGDEFCLLAPVRGEEVAVLLDGAAEALSEQGDGFHVTTSFGAVFLPDDAHAARAALGEADTRLYAQKHHKRALRERTHQALVQALHEREPGLAGHTHGVTALALSTGQRLGLGEGELEELERAAQLHDIGKIAVPDQILRKPGPLSEHEWRFIHQHTLVGQRILAASPALRRIGEIVRATHEHWDGSGYPDGLQGEAIPLAARLIAVCDAFDAMTTERPYRRALAPEEAVAELERCAGTQFDPAVVRAVVAVVRERVAAA